MEGGNICSVVGSDSCFSDRETRLAQQIRMFFFPPRTYIFSSFQHHSSGDVCLTSPIHQLKAKQTLNYFGTWIKDTDPISGGKRKGQGQPAKGLISPVPPAPVTQRVGHR